MSKTSSYTEQEEEDQMVVDERDASAQKQEDEQKKKEQQEKEQQEKERLDQEQLIQEQQVQQRQLEEQKQRDEEQRLQRAAKEREEAQKQRELEEQQAEQQRLKQQREQEERLLREKEERDRLQREKEEQQERERLQREKEEQQERDRLQREKEEQQERERLQREQQERERLQREKEQQRLQREKEEQQERERLQREKEQQRLQRENEEQQRQQRVLQEQQAEQQRLEQQRLEEKQWEKEQEELRQSNLQQQKEDNLKEQLKKVAEMRQRDSEERQRNQQTYKNAMAMQKETQSQLEALLTELKGRAKEETQQKLDALLALQKQQLHAAMDGQAEEGEEIILDPSNDNVDGQNDVIITEAASATSTAPITPSKQKPANIEKAADMGMAALAVMKEAIHKQERAIAADAIKAIQLNVNPPYQESSIARQADQLALSVLDCSEPDVYPEYEKQLAPKHSTELQAQAFLHRLAKAMIENDDKLQKLEYEPIWIFEHFYLLLQFFKNLAMPIEDNEENRERNPFANKLYAQRCLVNMVGKGEDEQVVAAQHLRELTALKTSFKDTGYYLMRDDLSLARIVADYNFMRRQMDQYYRLAVDFTATYRYPRDFRLLWNEKFDNYLRVTNYVKDFAMWSEDGHRSSRYLIEGRQDDIYSWWSRKGILHKRDFYSEWEPKSFKVYVRRPLPNDENRHVSLTIAEVLTNYHPILALVRETADPDSLVTSKQLFIPVLLDEAWVKKYHDFVTPNLLSHRELLEMANFNGVFAQENGAAAQPIDATTSAVIYVSALALIQGGSTITMLDEYLCATGLDAAYASNRLRTLAGGSDYEQHGVYKMETVELNCGVEGYAGPETVREFNLLATECDLAAAENLECLNIRSCYLHNPNTHASFQLIGTDQVEREFFGTIGSHVLCQDALAKAQAIKLAVEPRSVQKPKTTKALAGPEKQIFNRLVASGAIEDLAADMEKPFYEIDHDFLNELKKKKEENKKARYPSKIETPPSKGSIVPATAFRSSLPNYWKADRSHPLYDTFSVAFNALVGQVAIANMHELLDVTAKHSRRSFSHVLRDLIFDGGVGFEGQDEKQMLPHLVPFVDYDSTYTYLRLQLREKWSCRQAWDAATSPMLFNIKLSQAVPTKRCLIVIDYLPFLAKPPQIFSKAFAAKLADHSTRGLMWDVSNETGRFVSSDDEKFIREMFTGAHQVKIFALNEESPKAKEFAELMPRLENLPKAISFVKEDDISSDVVNQRFMSLLKPVAWPEVEKATMFAPKTSFVDKVKKDLGYKEGTKATQFAAFGQVKEMPPKQPQQFTIKNRGHSQLRLYWHLSASQYLEQAQFRSQLVDKDRPIDHGQKIMKQVRQLAAFKHGNHTNQPLNKKNPKADERQSSSTRDGKKKQLLIQTSQKEKEKRKESRRADYKAGMPGVQPAYEGIDFPLMHVVAGWMVQFSGASSLNINDAVQFRAAHDLAYFERTMQAFRKTGVSVNTDINDFFDEYSSHPFLMACVEQFASQKFEHEDQGPYFLLENAFVSYIPHEDENVRPWAGLPKSEIDLYVGFLRDFPASVDSVKGQLIQKQQNFIPTPQPQPHPNNTQTQTDSDAFADRSSSQADQLMQNSSMSGAATGLLHSQPETSKQSVLTHPPAGSGQNLSAAQQASTVSSVNAYVINVDEHEESKESKDSIHQASYASFHEQDSSTPTGKRNFSMLRLQKSKANPREYEEMQMREMSGPGSPAAGQGGSSGKKEDKQKRKASDKSLQYAGGRGVGNGQGGGPSGGTPGGGGSTPGGGVGGTGGGTAPMDQVE